MFSSFSFFSASKTLHIYLDCVFFLSFFPNDQCTRVSICFGTPQSDLLLLWLKLTDFRINSLYEFAQCQKSLDFAKSQHSCILLRGKPKICFYQKRVFREILNEFFFKTPPLQIMTLFYFWKFYRNTIATSLLDSCHVIRYLPNEQIDFVSIFKHLVNLLLLYHSTVSRHMFLNQPDVATPSIIKIFPKNKSNNFPPSEHFHTHIITRQEDCEANISFSLTSLIWMSSSVVWTKRQPTENNGSLNE